jgi:hypothetical protein
VDEGIVDSGNSATALGTDGTDPVGKDTTGKFAVKERSTGGKEVRKQEERRRETKDHVEQGGTEGRRQSGGRKTQKEKDQGRKKGQEEETEKETQEQGSKQERGDNRNTNQGTDREEEKDKEDKEEGAAEGGGSSCHSSSRNSREGGYFHSLLESASANSHWRGGAPRRRKEEERKEEEAIEELRKSVQETRRAGKPEWPAMQAQMKECVSRSRESRKDPRVEALRWEASELRMKAREAKGKGNLEWMDLHTKLKEVYGRMDELERNKRERAYQMIRVEEKGRKNEKLQETRTVVRGRTASKQSGGSTTREGRPGTACLHCIHWRNRARNEQRNAAESPAAIRTGKILCITIGDLERQGKISQSHIHEL